MEIGLGRRICLLLGAAVVLVLAPASAVAEAPPLTGTINAVDLAFKNPATGQNKVVIAPGGTVEFAYPSGATTHNVNFTGAAPTSRTQTAGSSSGAVPPLPAVPTAAGWAGSCSFNSEGTYAFACQLHPSMKGSVIVSATVPPPEEPTGPGGSGGGGSTGGGGSGGAGGTDDAPAGSGLQVPRKQPGPLVRGSIRVARAGSQLRVDLFARRSALGGKGAGEVKVGHLAKPVAAGRRSFAAKLNAAAADVLAGGGSLPVRVRVTVHPPSGSDFVVGTMATIG